jgi:nucleolin
MYCCFPIPISCLWLLTCLRGGLYLKTQPYKATRSNKAPEFAPKIVEGYNRIYVGNLSWDITEDDLRKLFSDCKISSIRFGMDKETEEFRGYAHVDFSDSLSLTMALKLDQQIVCGRPVKISCAVPNKGVGTHSRSAPTIQVAENAAENVSENTESATGSIAISGKIRRRTCYECGEKGHLSSACPKKQNADPINSGAS